MAGSRPSRRASRTCSYLPFSHTLGRAPCRVQLLSFRREHAASAWLAGHREIRLWLKAACRIEARVVRVLQVVLHEARMAVDSSNRQILIQNLDPILPPRRQFELL